jgi:hypothetical protein
MVAARTSRTPLFLISGAVALVETLVPRIVAARGMTLLPHCPLGAVRGALSWSLRA